MLNSACPLPQSIVCGTDRPAGNARLPETLSLKHHPREVCGGKRAGRHVPGRTSPAYWLVLLAWFCALTVTGWAQISPGPLSRAHQSLSGATQCTSCHKLAAGAASFKCLECHSDIAGRVAAKRGLHASFGAVSASQKECATCHSEHNGENFAIIRWNPAPGAFDHSKTGYLLEGKHAGLACARCHTAAHIAPSERASISIKDLNRTYLGVSRACVTCHQDKHQGRLGPNCQQCHGFNDWKVLSGPLGRFDHSRTRYPLTGLHQQVTCQKCHLPGAGGQPKYVGLAFSTCTDCHSDPHRGTFAGTCQSCHNTGGWKRVSAAAVSERFDHSRTKFPLLGKHADVRCDQCHAGGDFKKTLAFQKCSDCHQDAHQGQFLKRADKGECSSCHNLDGFKPALFGLKEHAATAYPLQGKHASVKCGQCHIPAGRATVYKIKFAQCTDCHQDEHQGQFARTPYFNQCQQCHDLNGYRPSTFTLARHQQTRFPLGGGHVATPCNECHRPKAELLATATAVKPAVVYRFEDRSCTACHHDPHQGQFRERMLRVSAGTKTGCEVCHSTETWSDLRKFDHVSTKFPLLGAHRAVACMDCHKPPNLETKLRNVDFRAAPMKCEECHQDVHGGQFARAGQPTACASCHDSGRWKPSLFDHETRTAFQLKGAHRNVRCEGCHKSIRLVAGKQVLFYKPTPTACVDCHGPTGKPAARSGRSAAIQPAWVDLQPRMAM
ncbi:MAG TPA: cytochrome c3 family protein [Terriglobales bacterium]|nr:cytochrome c3 family protein [Terriglobales bacterium]